jgi:DNA-binding transcriptional LysR family regulator
MDWDKLRIFLAVSDAESFTHAGERLNLSQSAVSRQISALEESLNVPLFHRHARGLKLTEQGEVLHVAAREIFAKLAMTEAILNESKDVPKGPLKITTTIAFGSMWLTPRLPAFLKRYPEIQVTLVVDDDELDLSMREADVAIRMTAPRQSDLIQRHLVTFHFHLYASAGYVAENGQPARLSDLRNHRLVTYGDVLHPPFPDVNWIMRVGGIDESQSSVLAVNNFFGILQAVESGAGIAALPDYMAKDRPHLLRLLPDLEAPAVPAYFVYPEELRNSKRISVLRDFLLETLASEQF